MKEGIYALNEKGLKQVQVTVKYVLDNVDRTETVVIDREEVEREGNRRRGVEYKLDVDWRTISDMEFIHIIGAYLNGFANTMIRVPLNGESPPDWWDEEYPQYKETEVYIPPANVRQVNIVGVYED